MSENDENSPERDEVPPIAERADTVIEIRMLDRIETIMNKAPTG